MILLPDFGVQGVFNKTNIRKFKMNKSLKSLLFTLLVGGVSLGVYAACGDSVCGDYRGEYTCMVDDGSGVLRECTQIQPCTIDCS